ncbi:MAG TPA: ATP-binding protein [Polyangiaceae bacterium]|nr:ATP-binding protein [Polyangiaceae bacterium]
MAEASKAAGVHGESTVLRSLTVPRVSRLLAFARELQRAATFQELLLITREEVLAAVGYAHTWLFVADKEDFDEVRLIDVAGAMRDLAWELAPVLKIRGDAMMEELASSDEPVVVGDARTDPRTNKQLVAQLGNRTIVNVPLRLLDAPFGALGTGTFGDEEGCQPPTREQLDYLIGMASQVSVAAGRIRFLEERRRAAEKLRKAEEQFLHAQKMEAVGRLAGSIAHDFNNLLSVILSYSSMLLDDLQPSGAVREDIEMIKMAGERAAELTRHLLAFSRQQVQEPRILDLNEVLENAERLFKRLLGVDIRLSTRLDPQLWKVKVDPGQMDQVVMNLAMNARDAMPSGGTLTLETKNVLLEQPFASEHFGVKIGPHVVLSVSDTGTGMDRETQARIFEPFFTTKEKGKGTGLGLATVFGIVKQSQGAIAVQSSPGAGATFQLYFPRVQGEEAAADEHVQPQMLNGSETILLVEDQDEVRQVAGDILRRFGYRVLEARNAAEALDTSERHALPVHLLLTDVVMPQMSGPELAARLRTRRPSLRVLYTSGYSEGAELHPAIDDEKTIFLHKPLIPETLAQSVREVLDARPTSTLRPLGEA